MLCVPSAFVPYTRWTSEPGRWQTALLVSQDSCCSGRWVLCHLLHDSVVSRSQVVRHNLSGLSSVSLTHTHTHKPCTPSAWKYYTTGKSKYWLPSLFAELVSLSFVQQGHNIRWHLTPVVLKTRSCCRGGDTAWQMYLFVQLWRNCRDFYINVNIRAG